MREIAMRISRRFADEACSDLVDECFAAEGQRGRLANYNGQRPLRCYLAKIVTRRVYHYLWKHRRERLCEDPLQQQADDSPGVSQGKTPAEIAADNEAKQRLVAVLREYLEQLTPETRQVFYYRFLRQMKLSDIGRILGIHKGNVQKRLKNLLRRLPAEVEGMVRQREQSAAVAESARRVFKELSPRDLSEVLLAVLQEMEPELQRFDEGGDA
jgi:RNA polymerase sigma factor (sigma-70 family)